MKEKYSRGQLTDMQVTEVRPVTELEATKIATVEAVMRRDEGTIDKDSNSNSKRARINPIYSYEGDNSSIDNIEDVLHKRSLLSTALMYRLDDLFQEKEKLEAAFQVWLKDHSISNAELGLCDGVDRTEVINLPRNFTKVDKTYVLALIFPPSSAALAGDCYENTTTKEILDPILGKNCTSYIELLHFGVKKNADINLDEIKKIVADPKNIICINYRRRIQIVLEIRNILGLKTVLWVGGPDAKSAFLIDTSLLVSFMPETKYNLYFGDFASSIVISQYHPSASKMARGNVNILNIILNSLRLVTVVTTLLTEGVEVTEASLIDRLEEVTNMHYKMVQENKSVLSAKFGEELLKRILKSKPSLLHWDLSWLHIILQLAENLCEYRNDKDKLAKIAAKRIWYKEDVESGTAASTAFGEEGFRTWLNDVMKYGRKAQSTIVDTAKALTAEGFIAGSILSGNAGSGIAQGTIVDTAKALTAEGFIAERILSGNAGSGIAQGTIVDTAKALTAEGFIAEKFLQGDGASHAAQSIMLTTILTLRELGFANYQICKLMCGSNLGAKSQMHLLINIKSLINQAHTLSDVCKILAGSKSMSVVIQDAVTNLCIDLKNKKRSNAYIVEFVHRGRSDTNRTKVAKDFINSSR